MQSLMMKAEIKQFYEEIITEVVALKRAVLAFSGVEVLHRVVMPYPVQDVPKDAVREDTTPQELL